MSAELPPEGQRSRGTVSRRETLELIGKTSLLALFAAACRRTLPPVLDPKRPNIVYIHSHDTGRYVEPYGFDVSTPRLQRFADEGMVFRQAFAASPTCSPSRAALLTGMTPGCNGMKGLAHKGESLNDYGQTLIPFLEQQGYTTALAGIQHIAAHADPKVAAARIGYDELLPIRGGRAKAFADAAVAYLNRPVRGPFFLDIGFGETHTTDDPSPAGSYFGYENGDPATAELPINLADTVETRRDMADFEVAAGQLDFNIGRILDTLEARGLADNTLVMITTDHGIPLPGMKANHTDGGLGVMLMLRGPGGFNGGRVSNALVSNIDVFPTICEVLGVPVPAWVQGKSLMPLVRGEVEEINEAVFAEYESHAVPDPVASVRTRDHKYIRRLDGNDVPRYRNTDDTQTKALWLREGWDLRLAAPEQLYDLKNDPAEKINLAADPAYAGVLSEMRGRMVERMERYDNPLLRRYNVANAPPIKAPVALRLLPTVEGGSDVGTIYYAE